MRPTEWTKEQIEYLKTNWLYESLPELAKALGISPTVIGRKARSLGLPPKNHRSRLESEYQMDVCKLLNHLHWEKNMSILQMSKYLRVSRMWINTMMKECNIRWRDSSESVSLRWQTMTPSERKRQVRAAHQKMRELISQGHEPAFKEWEQRNPELMSELRRKNGRLMSIKRDLNGNNWMLGRVGSLHHGWRGGKAEYRKLRILAEGNWRTNRKLVLERDNYTCQECGANGQDVIIDVHHIVGVRAGGTNLIDNLISYCRSCHISIERAVTDGWTASETIWRGE